MPRPSKEFDPTERHEADLIAGENDGNPDPGRPDMLGLQIRFLRGEVRIYSPNQKLLTPAEEIALGRIIQNPKSTEEQRDAALRQFVVRNYRLALKWAKRLKPKRTLLVDAFQDACLGVLKAARDYDPEREIRFSTYAVPKIKQAVNLGGTDTGESVAIPVHTFNHIASLRRELAEKQEQKGCSPLSPKEIEACMFLVLQRAYKKTPSKTMVNTLQSAWRMVGDHVSLSDHHEDNPDSLMSDIPNGDEHLDEVANTELNAMFFRDMLLSTRTLDLQEILVIVLHSGIGYASLPQQLQSEIVLGINDGHFPSDQQIAVMYAHSSFFPQYGKRPFRELDPEIQTLIRDQLRAYVVQLVKTTERHTSLSFREIAQLLAYSRQRVEQFFRNGMEKMRVKARALPERLRIAPEDL